MYYIYLHIYIYISAIIIEELEEVKFPPTSET